MTEPNDESALEALYSSHLGGGPAFPSVFPQPAAQGMALADAVALAVLPACLTQGFKLETSLGVRSPVEWAVHVSMRVADTFLAERAKRGAA